MNSKTPTLKSLAAAAALIAGIGAATDQAHASLVLTLESAGTTVTIVDNGVGDMDAGVGMIAFMGVVGDFTTNMTGGYGIGYAPWPTLLNLAGFSMSGSGGGTLTLTLEEDNYTPSGPTSRFVSTIGGTIGTGTVSNQSFLDASGTAGVLGSLLADHGTDATMSYSDDIISSDIPLAGPYGLAVQVTIVHTIAGATQYTSQIRIAEPATLGLFGLALAGFGLLARRRLLH